MTRALTQLGPSARKNELATPGAEPGRRAWVEKSPAPYSAVPGRPEAWLVRALVRCFIQYDREFPFIGSCSATTRTVCFGLSGGLTCVLRSRNTSLALLGGFASKSYSLRHGVEEFEKRLGEEKKVFDCVCRRFRRVMVRLVSKQANVIGPILHRPIEDFTGCQRVRARAKLPFDRWVNGLQTQFNTSTIAHRGEVKITSAMRASGLNEDTLDFGRNMRRRFYRGSTWYCFQYAVDKIIKRDALHVPITLERTWMACIYEYYARLEAYWAHCIQEKTFLCAAKSDDIEAEPDIAVRTIVSELAHV